VSGLRARIIRLERNVPTGLAAELRALSDEELERRLDELLMRASEEDSYGDKLTLEAGVSVRQMSDEHLNARIAYLLGHRPGAVQGDPLA
jgi:ribosomal protein L29